MHHTSYDYQLTRWAPLPLRLIVGYGFMSHGEAKLARGADAFAATLSALHVPWPHLMAWLTIASELIGGAAVFVGAFVSVAAVPLIAVMLVAMITVHLPFGFSSIRLTAVTADGPQFGKPGVETALLYVAALLSLVLSGAGPWSIDRWRDSRNDVRRRAS